MGSRRKRKDEIPYSPISSSYLIVMLGKGSVGKSSLVLRYFFGYFNTNYDPTVEDSYEINKEIGGISRRLDVMDTAGQESYKALTDSFMKKGKGFFVVYAVNESFTFEECRKTLPSIYASKEEEKQVPIVIVGNKIDIVEDHGEEARKVKREEVESWIKEESERIEKQRGCETLIAHVETSAKENINLELMFERMIEMMDRCYAKTEEAPLKKRCILF